MFTLSPWEQENSPPFPKSKDFLDVTQTNYKI